VVNRSFRWTGDLNHLLDSSELNYQRANGSENQLPLEHIIPGPFLVAEYAERGFRW
jgi:hypothetical protein